MMIVKGSLNHSTCGRRKKSIGTMNTKRTKRLDTSHTTMSQPPPLAHTIGQNYPSHVSSRPPSMAQTPRIQREKSEKYTVAIAYNKGAYQVIPNEDIKYIGK